MPGLIVKETLTDSEVLECKKAIYHVVGMESRNEALHSAASATRTKGAKRYEQPSKLPPPPLSRDRRGRGGAMSHSIDRLFLLLTIHRVDVEVVIR